MLNTFGVILSSGEGGSRKITITTDVGASVTIEKDDTSPITKTASNEGKATFEDVDLGTWDVTVALDGATTTGTVTVTDEFVLNLPVGVKLGDLPLKSKIKIGGKKWILFAKNHAGYPDNSVTLISESILENRVFDSGNDNRYQPSDIRTYLTTTFFNTFSEKEKGATLTTNFKTKRYNGGYDEFNDKVFLLSATEVGLESDANEGSNLGFNSNSDRIANLNGSPSYWWLRTPYASGAERVRSVYSGGTLYWSYAQFSRGLRPACNLSASAIFDFNPDSEGYYVIK